MRADAVRGHLDGLLLAVLEPGPLHGYAIIAAVQQRSGGALERSTRP
jgi:DNA-binding PadR family transcriptional regulator